MSLSYNTVTKISKFISLKIDLIVHQKFFSCYDINLAIKILFFKIVILKVNEKLLTSFGIKMAIGHLI